MSADRFFIGQIAQNVWIIKNTGPKISREVIEKTFCLLFSRAETKEIGTSNARVARMIDVIKAPHRCHCSIQERQSEIRF